MEIKLTEILNLFDLTIKDLKQMRDHFENTGEAKKPKDLVPYHIKESLGHLFSSRAEIKKAKVEFEKRKKEKGQA